MKIKKQVISFILFLSLFSIAKAQEIFQPGWYMVVSGAQIKVVQGNSDDAINESDWTQLNYGANEVLLVFNFAKDKYYCYDPDGRSVLVKGKASLQKIDSPGRPGKIIGEEDIKIGLDLSLSPDNNVWLTSYNAANKTATILLADGQKADIPQTNIQDLKEYIDLMDKYTEWHSVE